MNSIEESCTPFKKDYDNCFNSWFKDVFLKSNSSKQQHDKVCGEEFKEYQACLKKAWGKHNISSKEIHKDILGTENEKRTSTRVLLMAAVDALPSEADYPLRVNYCGLCTMPPEYCEYGPDPPKCYEWMKTNLPADYARLVEGVSEQLDELSVGEGKRQTRGGKASKAARKTKKKLQFETTKLIKISRAQRGKKKTVTVIVGLKTYSIELKKASKSFAQHFSCGSSVTGDDEIVIQGDVSNDIIDFIQNKWPEVEDDSIELLEDHKK